MTNDPSMTSDDPAATDPNAGGDGTDQGATDPVLQALQDAQAAIQKAMDAYQGEEQQEPPAEEAGAPAGGAPMGKQGGGNMLKALGIGD